MLYLQSSPLLSLTLFPLNKKKSSKAQVCLCSSGFHSVCQVTNSDILARSGGVKKAVKSCFIDTIEIKQYLFSKKYFYFFAVFFISPLEMIILFKA